MSLYSQFNTHRYQRYFVDLRTLYQRREIVVYTGIILSLFAIAFFGLFALRPTLVTIAGLYREIEDKKVVKQKLQTKINNLRQAQTNYAQVANSVYIVNQALPPDPSATELVYQIEVLAQKANIALSSVSYTSIDLLGKNPKQKTSSQTASKLPEIGIELTLKGDFENLKNFLDSLENLRRIIIIDSFGFNKSKSEGAQEETQTMTLNLTLKTFYYAVTSSAYYEVTSSAYLPKE